jgi:hypothetical protein
VSRVTKLMRHRRSDRRKTWRRPRKHVTHVRGRTIVFGPGRISVSAHTHIAGLTSVSFHVDEVAP